ncbi:MULTISPECIES: class F sortase [Thermomonospora]|uniref:Peptidase C60 sortase A and B n=1 Tax=Thermomonospora curvata (strain ATCC 19995 / DSM 43183 / JCM 3096 / KCTC 9072 / NBRC 15933 / NCIMB 10081 / Henssen B9) TaxID=471852 RepID=D1A2Y5_THECD|nr:MULTISPECIES: class F sortase [Thermomonospora]ACY97933.1 peptidase C60 sortase A and B [Thermomonospora curvata DSM 43183]PKK14212.1 MAG: class F sortase [Thermomonospora sp. CIF 1]
MTSRHESTPIRRGLQGAPVLMAALLGLVMIALAVGGPAGPPQPPAWAAAARAADHSGPLLPRSAPLRVRIPAIGVQAPLAHLGLNPDASLQVPPAGRPDLAGWYRGGPAPGERGPAVIVGHVDSPRGPAVFYDLGRLRPHDRIEVDRADGRVAVFTVESIERVPKERFPTERVYGPLDHAGLRLITCGGRFDRARRGYRDNVIVYAHQTAVR